MVARPEAEPIHHRNTGHVHPRGIAATPDAHAYDGDDLVLVDAKTAATDDHWTDTEPPAYYVASSCGSSDMLSRREPRAPGCAVRSARLSFRMSTSSERDDALIGWA